MTYAIVYSSRTGNTERLAQAIRQALPPEECLYFGPPAPQARAAERIYVGFWTDKGDCDAQTRAFLSELRGKEIFLFGTAGFGGASVYFRRILTRVAQGLEASNRVIGAFMCQGKMPMAVRERYEKMLASPNPAPNLEQMIQNFDQALSHPDGEDLQRLTQAVSASYSEA